MRAISVLFCAVALLSSAAAPPHARADIFQLTDADGVVHYTNVQPRGTGWRRTYRESKVSSAQAGGNVESTARRPVNPERVRLFEEHIREAAKLYQLPEAFLRAIVMVESNFYPDAVSEDGAIGLMQLMPSTAKGLGVHNSFDPEQAIMGGAKLLAHNLKEFKSVPLALAAYNAGGGAVHRYGGIPPFAETQAYVPKVQKALAALGG